MRFVGSSPTHLPDFSIIPDFVLLNAFAIWSLCSSNMMRWSFRLTFLKCRTYFQIFGYPALFAVRHCSHCLLKLSIQTFSSTPWFHCIEQSLYIFFSRRPSGVVKHHIPGYDEEILMRKNQHQISRIKSRMVLPGTNNIGSWAHTVQHVQPLQWTDFLHVLHSAKTRQDIPSIPSSSWSMMTTANSIAAPVSVVTRTAVTTFRNVSTTSILTLVAWASSGTTLKKRRTLKSRLETLTSAWMSRVWMSMLQAP